MKLLLFAADKSFSEESLAFTAVLAAKAKASVPLVYAASEGEEEGKAERRLQRAQQAVTGVEVIPTVVSGDPAERLLEIIHKDPVDMVILGARQGLGFIQRMFASGTPKLIGTLPVAVMMVREAKETLDRILICMGGTELSEKVIKFGALLAGATEADATLLYVTGSVPSMYTGLSEMEETVEEVLDSDTPLARHLRRGAEILNEQGVQGELEQRHGTVAEGILREATRGNFDLVVLGASEASKSVKGWLMGNITQRVIDKSDCPVLIVK
jgi:nucleotide-binding universal stress UspA family protein